MDPDQQQQQFAFDPLVQTLGGAPSGSSTDGASGSGSGGPLPGPSDVGSTANWLLAATTSESLAEDSAPPRPLVGQDQAVDPNDKGAGVTGTWDMFGPKKGPKITGGYMDPPFNAHGDPFKYGGDDNSSDGQKGPTGMDALCGPGKHWSQTGNSGSCTPNNPPAPAPTPLPFIPKPKIQDEGNDFEPPADNGTAVV